MSRACGNCIACCTYLESDQVPMKRLTHCSHARLSRDPKKGELLFSGLESCGSGRGNCSIYDTRPSTCAKYSCLWVLGHGEKEDRPDISGVLVDTLLPIENSAQAKPLWAGAQDSPKGRRAVKNISKSINKPIAVAGFPETLMVRIVGRGYM